MQQKPTSLKLLKFFTFGLLTFFTTLLVNAQESYPYTCDADYEALTAKYWQYRDNFNKHFIKIDRNEVLGCVNDGLGQNPTDGCKLEKMV